MAGLIQALGKRIEELEKSKSTYIVYRPINITTANIIKEHFPDIEPNTFIIDLQTNLTCNGLNYAISETHKNVIIIDNVLHLLQVVQSPRSTSQILIWECDYIDSIREVDLAEGQKLANDLLQQFYNWKEDTLMLKFPSSVSGNVLATALSLVLIDPFDTVISILTNPLLNLGTLKLVAKLIIAGSLVDQLTRFSTNLVATEYLKYGFHIDPVRFGLAILQPGIRINLHNPILSDQALLELKCSREQIGIFTNMISKYYGELDKDNSVSTYITRTEVVDIEPSMICISKQVNWAFLIDIYQRYLNLALSVSKDIDTIIANILMLDFWALLYERGPLVDGGQSYSTNIYHTLFLKIFLIDDVRILIQNNLSNPMLCAIFARQYCLGRSFNKTLTTSEVLWFKEIIQCRNRTFDLLNQTAHNYNILAQKKRETTVKGGNFLQASKNNSNWVQEGHKSQFPSKHLKRI